ncbi:MAG: GTPase, partial [Acidimicrobiia bacterium]
DIAGKKHSPRRGRGPACGRRRRDVAGKKTMPTNVTPEYKKAEAAYKRAREPGERLELLKEMLRAIPKHKGTEHLQAEIKTKIKELTEELAGPKKTGARGGPPTVIKPDGGGQIVLLGAPNSGKSSLHAAVTGSHSTAGPYPFTTQFPQPGMVDVDDIAIQLVDLPAISSEHPVPWIANAVQQADGALLVVDVSHPGCVAEVVDLLDLLAQRKIRLIGTWPHGNERANDPDDPFTIVLPTLIVAAKADLVDDMKAEVDALCDLAELAFPSLAVSTFTQGGCDALGPWLFDALGVVRVYTKIPGKPADLGRPYTVRHGDTVGDVALLVHKDFVRGLRFARLWTRGEAGGGRQVGRDFVVGDGDVLELHA